MHTFVRGFRVVPNHFPSDVNISGNQTGDSPFYLVLPKLKN